MTPSLPDPARSSAVLVGVSKYHHLEDLPSVQNNLEALRAHLTDPERWGLPPENCSVLHQPASVDDVVDSLQREAEKVSDTLLFYFAGHGLIDDHNEEELYLALPHAARDRAHRTAVPYSWLRREVLKAEGAKRKIVILDCCYSGRALGRWMDGGDTDVPPDLFDIYGACVLTATARTRRALAPSGEKFTAFTGELITLLEEGVPAGPELLDMDTLYRNIEHRLRVRDRPRPERGQLDFGGQMALARNPAHPNYLKHQVITLRAERDALLSELAAERSRGEAAAAALSAAENQASRIRAAAEADVNVVPPRANMHPTEGWEIGNPGRAFRGVQSTIASPGGVPDVALDAAVAGNVRILASSVRGLNHRHGGQPRQDSYALGLSADLQWLVVAVANGIGGGNWSHRAAEIASRQCADQISTMLDAGSSPAKLNWQEIVGNVSRQVADGCEGLIAYPQRLSAGPARYTAARNEAATDLLALICETNPAGAQRAVFAGQVGDSTAWTLGDGKWHCLFPRDHEIDVMPASLTLPLNDSSGLTLPTFYGTVPAGAILFAMTDGVSDRLSYGSGEVAEALAHWWASPPPPLTFADQVGFGRRAFIDDRTVVGIWPAT